MVLEMKVPSPGESITEVEIAEWLVEDGDYVENPIKRKKSRRKNLKKRLPKKKGLKKKLMLPELRLRQLKRYWTKKVFPLLLYQVLEGMEESPRKML